MTLPTWHASVHHDGSELYVSNPYPALNETVTLRLRHSPAAPVQAVFLRTAPDGEQVLQHLTPAGEDPVARWWQVELTVREPVVIYRFILQTGAGVWHFSAGGLSLVEPLDSAAFRLLSDYTQPAWVHDRVFYQVFPDRFANGDPSNDPRPSDWELRGRRPQAFPWGQPPDPSTPAPMIFYGGDLIGLRQRLDYLQRLGANALYLNPVFTARSNHRYDVTDYTQVDPALGGDQALSALAGDLHARGMRYLLDIVPNHCGIAHPWFQAAQANAAVPEAAFFTFTHHPQEYASWLGVWSLPKLNYNSAELRRRMYEAPDSIFCRWLQPPFSADGWRLDVANMLARQGALQLGARIARGIRQAVKQTAPLAYLIGENFFDATPQLQGDQWDGVMNYAGFTFPLWNWLRGVHIGAWGWRDPITSPEPWPTTALEESWRQRRAGLPWVIALQQYNQLDSHDTGRIRSLLGGSLPLQRLAAAVQFTYPGVPGLYYGDEIGMLDDPHLSSRGCMPWDEARWNHDLLAYYAALARLRRSSSALQTGGFQFLAVEANSFAYLRASRRERVLLLAHRAAASRPAGLLPVAHGGVPNGVVFTELFSGARAEVKGGALPLPEQPQGASIWIQSN